MNDKCCEFGGDYRHLTKESISVGWTNAQNNIID